MIYTVTFNPSLDYTIHVENFELGKVNRTVQEDIYAGGKGINVSMVLKNLGYETTAFGFLSGFTGQEIERLLKEKESQPNLFILKMELRELTLRFVPMWKVKSMEWDR